MYCGPEDVTERRRMTLSDKIIMGAMHGILFDLALFRVSHCDHGDC